MNYFSEIFGLVTKMDPGTENGGLFFLHYLVLKLILCGQIICSTITPTDHNIFIKKMEAAKIEKGLYLRSSNHTQRTVSQDEQTGFFGTSFILKTDHAKEVWEYMKNHGGNYPATGKTNFYNPGDYYSWAVLSGSPASPVLAPWYTLNLLISSTKGKEDTSSKLIYLDELYLMKEVSSYANILWRYYSWKMERMYGPRWIKELYAIYFAREDRDFPLLQLSEAIK